MSNIALERKGAALDPRSGGQGRDAASPTQIPLSGWGGILRRTFQQVGENRATMVAGAVTYFTLLALVPALSALVSIYGIFADPGSVREHVANLASFVPQEGMQIINDQLTRLASQNHTTLGLTLIVSLAVALWSASSGTKTMFEAMNIAYGERESRNFFVLNGVALLFTLGGVVGVLLLAGVAVVLPLVLGFIGLGESFKWLIQVGSYVVVVLLMLTGIAVLYRWGPSRQQAHWRWITPGAVLAIVAIIIMSVLFSWYAANFAHYDKTYGSLGGLIGLLTWMWLSLTALIIGAELNAQVERQTGRDPTAGGAASRSGQGAAPSVAPQASDDPLAGKSAEWREGYLSATRQRGGRKASPGTVVFMLPLALLLEALRGRKGH